MLTVKSSQHAVEEVAVPAAEEPDTHHTPRVVHMEPKLEVVGIRLAHRHS